MATAARATNAESPVGRLAPSPTGLLHLGHARSFLLAWWSVRARGGSVVLDRSEGDLSPLALTQSAGGTIGAAWLRNDVRAQGPRAGGFLDRVGAADYIARPHRSRPVRQGSVAV